MSAGRALVISPRLPEFDRESGLLRVSHLIEMLIARDFEVTFGCLRTPTDPERYAYELEQRGVETYAPLDGIESLRDPSGFKLAIVAFWHVAEQFLPELRRLCPSTRVIVDSVDLHFLREMRDELRLEPGEAPSQLSLGHADRWTREVNAYAAADAVLTVSAKEAELINDFTGQPGLALHMPDTEELARSPVPARERRGILFLGNFLHAPNLDAAAYLCEDIVPRLDPGLLAEHPLSVVGTAAEQHMRELATDLSHVKTVGWVPSVIPYLNSARVCVVPLRYGAGTKRKVIQSLMVGTPTVTTTVGAEGLGVRDGREVLIADDAHGFARAVERLAKRPLLWRRLARRGREHVLGLHGRAVVDARFDHILETVLSRAARPAMAPTESDAASAEYARLVRRVREVVEADIPLDSRVLVATRGDNAMLGFDGRSGWHFPRDPDGRYAGYYPADSEAAVAHLEGLRAQGATHLVLPRTGFWWLTYYEGLQRHLDAGCRSMRRDEDVIVYQLTGDEEPAPEPTTRRSIPHQPPAANGHGPALAPPLRPGSATEPPPPATPEQIRRLQPSVQASAARYRNGTKPRRALVLGIYLADKPNTAAHVADTFARSADFEVHQRWIALGGAPAEGALGELTAMTVTEPTPKYELLNRLLAEEDLAPYDFIVTTDDDIVVPDGFLDLFLGIQESLGFDLAQPARTPNSHVDHPIVIQQRGVLARRTLFVEIGPLVSFSRTIYKLLLPFDETNSMGWGFENVWSYLLRERGRSQGIVDAVPVDHSIRKPVEHYRWADAVADRERYLESHPHLPLEECFRVLEVVGVDR